MITERNSATTPSTSERTTYFALLYSVTQSSDYFYGDTSLWGSKKGKRTIVRNTWRLRHSLLLFRGTIFEWGINRNYDMNRTPRHCAIKWSWGRKGESKCLLSDAKTWTRAYKRRYGKYRLLFNNCHDFVNRLGRYLATNCGR